MKPILISFAAGLLIGAIYAFLRVRSPAPPLVALAGLLGMVWGEQFIQGYLARHTNKSNRPATAQALTSSATNQAR